MSEANKKFIDSAKTLKSEAKKDESPEMNLKEACNYCENLSLAGHTDWRLPNMKELPTILNLSFSDSRWFA